MVDELSYYLGFSHFYGIGPTRFGALLNNFKSIKKAYLADKKELIEVIGVNWTEKFVKFRSLFDPIKKLEEIRKKEIRVIYLSHKLYPQSIAEISDPPICLYVKGDINNFNFDKDLCF